MSDYLSTHREAGGAAFEIGGSAKRLHIQAVLRIRSERVDALDKKQLSDHFEAFIPMLHGQQVTAACRSVRDPADVDTYARTNPERQRAGPSQAARRHTPFLMPTCGDQPSIVALLYLLHMMCLHFCSSTHVNLCRVLVLTIS